MNYIKMECSMSVPIMSGPLKTAMAMDQLTSSDVPPDVSSQAPPPPAMGQVTHKKYRKILVGGFNPTEKY